MKTPHGDYDVDVEEVDLDAETERQWEGHKNHND